MTTSTPQRQRRSRRSLPSQTPRKMETAWESPWRSPPGRGYFVLPHPVALTGLLPSKAPSRGRWECQRSSARGVRPWRRQPRFAHDLSDEHFSQYSKHTKRGCFLLSGVPHLVSCVWCPAAGVLGLVSCTWCPGSGVLHLSCSSCHLGVQLQRAWTWTKWFLQ